MVLLSVLEMFIVLLLIVATVIGGLGTISIVLELIFRIMGLIRKIKGRW